MVDDLDAQELRRRLTGRFGNPVEIHESIGSTNTRALEWAAAGAPAGAVVVADVQTAGRGRRDRDWVAAQGTALLFSVIVRLIGAGSIERLSVAAGVAVARALDETGVADVTLKWPNDVLVAGAKVCGILVESSFTGGTPDYAVVGIGVNVFGSSAELSARVGRPATALSPDHVRSVSRVALLASCLDHLERVVGDLDGGRGTAVMEEAAARSAVLGHTVRLRLADGSTSVATALRLLDTGALEVGDGIRTWVVTSGEIERVEAPDRPR